MISAGLMKAVHALNLCSSAIPYRFFPPRRTIPGPCARKPCRSATPRDGPMCWSPIPAH